MRGTATDPEDGALTRSAVYEFRSMLADQMQHGLGLAAAEAGEHLPQLLAHFLHARRGHDVDAATGGKVEFDLAVVQVAGAQQVGHQPAHPQQQAGVPAQPRIQPQGLLVGTRIYLKQHVVLVTTESF